MHIIGVRMDKYNDDKTCKNLHGICMFVSSMFVHCPTAGKGCRATAADKRLVTRMDVLRVALQIADDGELL